MEPSTPHTFEARLVMALLIAVSLIANISMDIHLPLAPLMVEELETTPFRVQLIFIISVLLTTITPLFWGGLSDCYGRRTLLIPSCVFMSVGQFGCAVASSIQALLVARTIQYVGVGAVLTVGLAVVCDLFQAQTRARMIALLEISIPIGLMMAPLIGAFTAQYLGWRYNFFILGVLQTALLIVLVQTLPETLKQKRSYSWKKSYQSIKILMQSPDFLEPVFLLALVNTSYMIFITHASFLYIRYFHLTELEFALHQSLMAGLYFVGLLVYRQLVKRYSLVFLLNVHMTGYIVYGIFMAFLCLDILAPSPFTITIVTLISSLVSGAILTGCSSLALGTSTTLLATRSSLIEFTMGSLGATFMLLSGWMSDQGPSWIFGLIVISVGASFWVWQRLLQRHSRPDVYLSPTNYDASS